MVAESIIEGMGEVSGIETTLSKPKGVDFDKVAAVFDTYGGRDFEKAMKKMERQIEEKVPGLELVTPGLSIKVKGIRGPIVEEELPKCREFGIKIATLLKEQA